MQTLQILSFLLSFSTLFGSSVEADTVLVLIRHAEKVDDSRDPELSEQGKARATALASFLRDARIEKVYSTDFIRTRETARPTAEAAATSVVIYQDEEELAGRLRSEGGRGLVVGHSNTIPDLVRLLGGDEGPPIADDEYDRLYLLVVSSGGEVTTTILRFSP